MALTEAGRLLLAHAEAVGRLRLGASTTLSQYVLPAWLPALPAGAADAAKR